MVLEIGRLCLKIAGRDAGKKCVIVENIDNNYVLIDGETRRRKCNILHVEPLKQVVKIKEKATHQDVVKALSTIDIKARETKPKKASEKPRRKRKSPEELREQKEKRKKARKVEEPKENLEKTIEKKDDTGDKK